MDYGLDFKPAESKNRLSLPLPKSEVVPCHLRAMHFLHSLRNVQRSTLSLRY